MSRRKKSHLFRSFLEGVVTATLWGTCIFIGMVLAKRIMAVIDFAHNASEIPSVFSSIFFYLLIPPAIALALILWRYFNILKYRKNSRRSDNSKLHPRALWLYGLNNSSLFELQDAKNQTVLFEKETSIIYLKGREEKK